MASDSLGHPSNDISYHQIVVREGMQTLECKPLYWITSRYQRDPKWFTNTVHGKSFEGENFRGFRS